MAGRDVLGYLVLESDKANSAYRLATLAQMPLAISAIYTRGGSPSVLLQASARPYIVAAQAIPKDAALPPAQSR